MQSSTPDGITQEHSDLEMRSPEEIKSDKIAFLKATAADGGRVKPSAEISFTVAKDCDELIAEGHLETYVDSAAGQTSVYVRASKAGKKFLQDLEVKAAESMSRALTKIALESPEQAILSAPAWPYTRKTSSGRPCLFCARLWQTNPRIQGLYIAWPIVCRRPAI
jgi:hypothetical protein